MRIVTDHTPTKVFKTTLSFLNAKNAKILLHFGMLVFVSCFKESEFIILCSDFDFSVLAATAN